MGTSAFDAMWDGPKPKRKLAVQAPDALDAAWDAAPHHAPSVPAAPDPTIQFNGEPARAGVVQGLLHGAAGGFAEKIGAGADALIDAAAYKAAGAGDFGPTFGKAYEQNLTARRAALDKFGHDSGKTKLASELVGGLGTMMFGGGVGAAGELLEAGRLAKIASAAKTGAKFGALYGAGDARGGVGDYAQGIAKGGTLGAVAGGLSVPTGEMAGYLASKLHLPQLVSKGADKAADFIADQTTEAASDGLAPTATRVLRRVAGSLGAKGKASSEVGQRAAMDEAAGFVPNDRPQSVSFGPSPIALDQAGPNVESLGKNVVRSQGPGKTILTQTLRDRLTAMRPSVSGALESTTGVPAGARLQPLRDAMQARSDEAATLYGNARAATADVPVDSPTLNAIAQTPVGQQALAWARVQKSNRNGSLPMAERPGQDSKELTELVTMGVPREKAVEALGESATTPPASVEVPDAETLHYAKQYLAKLARLGVHDGQGGKIATDAQGALVQWGKIRDELPDSFRAADDAFAQKSRIIDMINQGRNVFRTSENPTGRPGKAVATSLDALAQRASNATPEEAQGLQTGAATAAHALWKKAPTTIASPGRVFAQSPERVEQLSYAFPSPGKASTFQNTVKAWDDAQAQTQRLLGGSDTAGNLSEEAARSQSIPGALGQAMRGHGRGILSGLMSSLNAEAKAAERRTLDTEIAKLLASPSPTTLAEAQRVAQLRARLSSLLVKGGGVVGAQTGNQ